MSKPLWRPEVGEIVRLETISRRRGTTEVSYGRVSHNWARRGHVLIPFALGHTTYVWSRKHQRWSTDVNQRTYTILTQLPPDEAERRRYDVVTQELLERMPLALCEASPEAVRECARILGLEVTT